MTLWEGRGPGAGGGTLPLAPRCFSKNETETSREPVCTAVPVGAGPGPGPLTIMSVMVSMVWLMTCSASGRWPQSAAVKLRRYVWSVAMMLRRGSWGGHGGDKGDVRDTREPEGLCVAAPPVPGPELRARP